MHEYVIREIDISSVEENSDYSCEENSNEKYPDEESKFE